MTISSNECLKHYGNPELEHNMVIYDIPKELELGVIPKRVYCNKDLIKPLELAFKNIIARGLINQLKTWDGCFNIRKKRGQSAASLHSWGIAVDVNAAWNTFGGRPTLSAAFVKCFTDAGFEWGGLWQRRDAMHFQLKTI